MSEICRRKTGLNVLTDETIAINYVPEENSGKDFKFNVCNNVFSIFVPFENYDAFQFALKAVLLKGKKSFNIA